MNAPDDLRFTSQARALGSRRHQPDSHDARAAHEGGIWRGPTDGAWMKRLLAGSPPPRWSGGSRDALVAHR